VTGLSARSIASLSTLSGAVKAMRMKNLPVSRSQNWLDSAMLAPRENNSLVTPATIPGLSAQDRVRMKLDISTMRSCKYTWLHSELGRGCRDGCGGWLPWQALRPDSGNKSRNDIRFGAKVAPIPPPFQRPECN